MRALVIAVALLGARAAAADPAPAAPAVPACTDDARFDGASSKDVHVPTELVGKTAAEVARSRGEPACRSPERWRYWTPRGCAYEKTVTTLWFGRDGKVARVVAVRHFTGEECERVE